MGMGENMKTLLIQFFLENWQRKCVSFILASIIWLFLSHSITVTKTIHNIPVRIKNLSTEKIIEGMQENGLLNKRISLILSGKKDDFEHLSDGNLEVVIDASGKNSDWVAVIEKQNLMSLNSEFDPATMISKVIPYEIPIHPCKRVTEKIPVLITKPIGDNPKGFQFIDIWPYQLQLTVNGPEETVKQLKARGVKLTFNLNDIDPSILNHLPSTNDEVSYFVPNEWKKILLPQISNVPLEIDDPATSALRIDFSKEELIPIESPIPVLVYFPPKFSNTLNPETYQLAQNDLIVKKNGIKVISSPLFAKGASQTFVEIVKDMMQLVIIAAPKSERESLLWNIQCIHPTELEDRYVAKMLSESSSEFSDIQPHLREEYLRNRFRSYMNRFRLYNSKKEKLSLQIELQASAISVQSIP